MKNIHSLLAILILSSFILSCSDKEDKDDDAKTNTASFDMKKERAFIDSINAKWVGELKKGGEKI
jgi:hypothetical protein